MINKKAQTEIIGLAIVVVLVVLAMTLALKFYVPKENPSLRNEFVMTMLASNTANTFLHTTSRDCNLRTMKDLILDCAEGDTVVCGNNQDACTYAAQAADEIFSATLSKWTWDYHFTAAFSNQAPIIESGSACLGELKSKTFPLPSSSGSVMVRLDICGS